MGAGGRLNKFPRGSDGDYRQDSDLEPADKPLYAKQRELPRLPIPPLEATCKKYLASVHALAQSEGEYRNTEAAVRDFLRPGGFGYVLHERLLERAREHGQQSSWLALWWNQLGYLTVRDPVVINISYFYGFKDVPLGLPSSQCVRAAMIVEAALRFRQHIMHGTLPPTRVGKQGETTLDSVAYKYMFNSCRIPHVEHDGYALHDPFCNGHVTVICRDRVWAVPVADAEGRPFPLHLIESQLQHVLNHHKRESGSSGGGGGGVAVPAVGVMTAGERDTWAHGRTQLLADGNRDVLESIESSAFVLSLDDVSPLSLNETSRMLWHGNGHNRWWDKPMQFIVFANGKAGLIGEHAMMDGMPSLRMSSFVTTHTMKRIKGETLEHLHTPSSHLTASSAPTPAPPMCLEFGLSPASLKMLANAATAFEELTTAHGLEVLVFDGYGGDAIKKWGVSPDAFFQMALQLAYYRMHGVFRATYEPAHTHKFLHGRTACVRTVSDHSVAWVKSMCRDEKDESAPPKPATERVELLKAAAKHHVKLAVEASNGNDCDRHLFGLSMLVNKGRGETPPAIFTDPMFKKSKHWAISTSHLTHELLDNWGWGEVVPDGVGVAYMIKKRSIHVNVTANVGQPGQDKWPETLADEVRVALEDMRDVCEEAAVATDAARSRL